MPKNRKPRKEYKPRAIRRTGCSYPRETINEIKDIINGMGLVAEVSLPQGVIDDKQCVKLQDLLNWGGMLMFDRKWKGQEAAAAALQGAPRLGRSGTAPQLRQDPRLCRQGRRASDHSRSLRRDRGNA